MKYWFLFVSIINFLGFAMNAAIGMLVGEIPLSILFIAMFNLSFGIAFLALYFDKTREQILKALDDWWDGK